MIDITHKPTTLREATAEATVSVNLPETIAAVKEKRVPKGDVLEAARVAALFGVKRTADMIPDCHPLPVEAASVDPALVFEEVVETDMEIISTKLVSKTGGKSDWQDSFGNAPRAAVLVISDGVAAGRKEDKAGAAIVERLKRLGLEATAQAVVPDEPEQVATQVRTWATQGVDLILTTGGTGLSPRDRTPEAIAPVLDREVPGIMEAARSYGQERMPWAMMSRGVAGMIGRTLVITLPGSTRGAQETMDALFPFVLHVIKVQEHAFRHGM